MTPNKKKGAQKPKRTELQKAVASAIEHLGKRGILALQSRLGLNTELKYVDTAGTTTVTATLTSRIASPTIAQGLTALTRTGSSIRVVDCELRINAASASATAYTQIRVIVTRFLEASAPATSAILQSTTDFSSPLNHLFKANGLQLLDDFVIVVGTGTVDGVTSIVKHYKNDNWHMQWTDADTTGAPANLVSGGIYVHWYADQISVAPIMNSTMRIRYVDN